MHPYPVPKRSAVAQAPQVESGMDELGKLSWDPARYIILKNTGQ